MEVTKLSLEKIPFPARESIFTEFASHPDEEKFDLSECDLSDLYEVHQTLGFRVMNRLFPEHRSGFEAAFLSIILSTVLSYGLKEKFMIESFREGGMGIFLILALGLGFLFFEILKFFRVVIIKDHRKENLNLDTQSVILSSAVLLILGVFTTVIGFYVSANAVLSNHGDSIMFLTGVKESITNLILSLVLTTLLLLTHLASRKFLIFWRAPVL